MHLSREAGWYDVRGNALYVRKGEQFADNHPAVKALPSIFDKVSDDGPPAKVKVAQAVAAAVARTRAEPAPKAVPEPGAAPRPKAAPEAKAAPGPKGAGDG